MRQLILLSCFVFLAYLFLLPTGTAQMFSDPDTYWHIAAGDLIRETGALPEHDSWSYTAGDQRWYNISWAWDVLISFAYEQAGWHGVIIANSITIAAAVALIFAACLLSTRDGVTSFLATMVSSLSIFNCSVRPLQVSTLCIAGVALLLILVYRRHISVRWLALIPLVMLVWVNMHGGFLVGFFLLGVYALDAWLVKDKAMLRALILTGCGCALAMLCNPYGIYVLAGAMRTINSDAHTIISEWRAFGFGNSPFPTQFYVVLFTVLVLMRKLPVPRTELWIAYTWFALSMLSIRHMNILSVVSPPLLAVAFHQLLMRSQPAGELTPLAVKLIAFGRRMLSVPRIGLIVLSLSALISLTLFTTPAARLYQTHAFQPLPELVADIRYVEEHYADRRLLTGFSLGGPLIFYTRGKVPVFIDGREQTAYPSSLIRDYVSYYTSSPSWPDILDRYRIDGAMVMASDTATLERLSSRKGWRIAYKGRTATVLLRDVPANRR